MNAMQIQARPRAIALSLPLLLAALTLLSACGGGGDDNGGGDQGGGIPTASVEEFSKWAAGHTPDDQAEPFGVDGLSPPTSESAEPTVMG